MTAASSMFWLHVQLCLVLQVLGQATIMVNVGDTGSFYDPPTISAMKGDTIIFTFSGVAHTVTQCSFELPCVPLPGGFDSGIAGIGSNRTGTPPTWSLVLTDDTQPIYFFCQATQPQSHCAQGMVGAINVPSQTNYTAFQSAAKAVTGTPKPTPTVLLDGVGAFATNSPVTPTTSSTTSSTSSSPSSTATSTDTSSSSSSAAPSQSAATTQTKSSTSTAAIAGGVVGGIAAIIIAILIYLLIRARKKARALSEKTAAPISPEVQVTTEHDSGYDGGRRKSESKEGQVAGRRNLTSDSPNRYSDAATYVTAETEPRQLTWIPEQGYQRQQDSHANRDGHAASTGTSETLRTDFLDLATPDLPSSGDPLLRDYGRQGRYDGIFQQQQQQLHAQAQKLQLHLPPVRQDSGMTGSATPNEKERERETTGTPGIRKQRSHNAVNVHEIANQVAAILNPAPPVPPRVPDVPPTVPLHAPRPTRRLPVPGGAISPGPPSYES